MGRGGAVTLRAISDPADLGRTAAETALAIETLDKARAHELAA
jgi:hypothetical protein